MSDQLTHTGPVTQPNSTARKARHAAHGRSRRAERDTHACGTVVLVPARNEEAGLHQGLMSLSRQTQRPDMIIVIVNNSTDATEQIAKDFAARPDSPLTHVLVLDDNPHKKAGALNTGIDYIQRTTGMRLESAARFVVVMDADTEFHPSFLMRALRVLGNDASLGGVSAACRGRHTQPRSLWQRFLLGMQRIEYGRYAYTRIRRDVHTMSGAGSVYRTSAVQGLLDWRGEVFWQDARNLVEDYETTLALKETGWAVTANQWCVAYTDLMPTLPTLVRQRQRWVRGTVDTLRQRGWAKHTWMSIMSIIVGIVGFLYMIAWMGMTLSASLRHGLHVHPAYLALPVFWSAYSAWTVRHLGVRSVLVEACLLPEFLFNLLRAYWLIASVLVSYTSRRRPAAWSE